MLRRRKLLSLTSRLCSPQRASPWFLKDRLSCWVERCWASEICADIDSKRWGILWLSITESRTLNSRSDTVIIFNRPFNSTSIIANVLILMCVFFFFLNQSGLNWLKMHQDNCFPLFEFLSLTAFCFIFFLITGYSNPCSYPCSNTSIMFAWHRFHWGWPPLTYLFFSLFPQLNVWVSLCTAPQCNFVHLYYFRVLDLSRIV